MQDENVLTRLEVNATAQCRNKEYEESNIKKHNVTAHGTNKETNKSKNAMNVETQGN